MPNYTNTEQRNLAVVEALFSKERHQIDRLLLFADDAVWWNGLPLLPGNVGRTEHRGHEAIGKIFKASGSPSNKGIDSYDLSTNEFSDVVVLADGDFVVRQHTMTSTTLAGKPYVNVYCFVFRFNDVGKIAYLTEHWNTWHAYRTLFNNFEVEPAHPYS